MIDKQTFTADNLPEDFNVNSAQVKEFDPIDATETYTVEVIKAEVRSNPYYRPDEKDPAKQGSKYQFSFEFAILDDGEFYGRRLWDTTGTAFKPDSKKGATKLYRIVMAAMQTAMDWDACASFNPDTVTFVKNLQTEVVGKQLKVGLENTVSKTNGKTYSKIRVYNPIKKALPKFDQQKATELSEKIERKKKGGSK
jgi:hypothetical protein